MNTYKPNKIFTLSANKSEREKETAKVRDGMETWVPEVNKMDWDK